MRILDRALAALRRSPAVDAALRDRASAWERMAHADLALPHRHTRYVVVDVETTGLDLRRDVPIAIGAIALRDGAIALGDAYEVVLKQGAASADDNILIHGIGGEMQLAGRDPALALVEFAEYAGASPMVAFRAEFDRSMLVRATRSYLGASFRLPFIDLAFLLPALFRDAECRSLDDWLAHFGCEPVARHDPVADAYETAKLLLIALAAADAVDMATAQSLLAMQKAQRWLGTR